MHKASNRHDHSNVSKCNSAGLKTFALAKLRCAAIFFKKYAFYLVSANRLGYASHLLAEWSNPARIAHFRPTPGAQRSARARKNLHQNARVERCLEFGVVGYGRRAIRGCQSGLAR